MKLFLQVGSNASATYAVEIWTRDTDGTLMEKIGTLTNLDVNDLVDRALNEFTGDIDLAANTPYALVVDIRTVVTESPQQIEWSFTTSSPEDGGSMPGWSIDAYYSRHRDQTAWGTAVTYSSHVMEIHGYAIVFTQSEVDAHTTDPLPAADNPSDIRQEANRHQQLREDGVIPTISVSGCEDGGEAVFTFTRNGGTDENLAFTFSVNSGNTTISMGFGAGNNTREWRAPIGTWVRIEKSYHNYHSGDYIVGTRSAQSSSFSSCPSP